MEAGYAENAASGADKIAGDAQHLVKPLVHDKIGPSTVECESFPANAHADRVHLLIGFSDGVCSDQGAHLLFFPHPFCDS
jgi:hypothetical protein